MHKDVTHFLPCLGLGNFIAVIIAAYVPYRWSVLNFNNKSINIECCHSITEQNVTCFLLNGYYVTANSTCPSARRVAQPLAFVSAGPRHGVAPRHGGDQHQLATGARVRDIAFKEWKPMRSHIPATNRCHGVARVLPALVIVSHHCKILANISVTALLLKTGDN